MSLRRCLKRKMERKHWGADPRTLNEQKRSFAAAILRMALNNFETEQYTIGTATEGNVRWGEELNRTVG